MKRSYFKIKPRKPMKRTRLHLVGHSTTSEMKIEIQALLRELAIKQYKICVLASFSQAGMCGGYNKKGELILQAEHLNSRNNTATFGDMRNIVLLCKRHHIFWKPQNSSLYWFLIEKIVGKERWKWFQSVRDDRMSHKVDLKLVLLELKQKLKTYD